MEQNLIYLLLVEAQGRQYVVSYPDHPALPGHVVRFREGDTVHTGQVVQAVYTSPSRREYDFISRLKPIYPAESYLVPVWSASA